MRSGLGWRALMCGAAASALLMPAYAQEEQVAMGSEEVIVTGEIVYRNRVDTAAPVLTYGLDYFERFEPSTVGDMLKRVPSATFISDVNEFDGLRLRGMDAGYSQILINGKKTPGGEFDRSFFVDRVPAELVEQIEIVRSSSADRPAEGIAGALNIVLKDAYNFEGVFLKGGAMRYDDGAIRGTGGVLWGGNIGEAAFSIGANVQGRHNPKNKVTPFYDGEGEFDDEIEYESDTRDGTDYSFVGSLAIPFGEAELKLGASMVDTDRTEDEYVETYEEDELDGVEAQHEDISQRNYEFDAELKLPWSMGETLFDLGYAKFEESTESTEFEADPGDPLEASAFETIDTDDDEVSATLAHTFNFGEAAKLKVGVDYFEKNRDAFNFQGEFDDGELEDESTPREQYEIEETRIDPYIKGTWQPSDSLVVEGGLRLETTDIDVTGADGSASQDYDFLAPSLHVRYDLTENDRVYFSAARNLRRPDFDLLAPYTVEEEPADGDEFIGNPDLKPEKAWGFDAGYERRLGKRGIIGINAFYRSVDDVIELVSTGEEVLREIECEDDDEECEPGIERTGLVFTSDNVNDGDVWGIELDLSTPLSFVGLDETGVFLNASWLDSSITDPITGEDRRFQNQPDYVVNVGFIQNIPTEDIAFGATYRHQGEAELLVLGERRITSYGGDLEVFVEKRINDMFAVRLTGQNLLNLEKREDIYEFDGDNTEEIIENMLAGEIDEIERENEVTGPVFQLVVRAAF